MAVIHEVDKQKAASAPTRKGIIDCDVHNMMPSKDAVLERYLPKRARQLLEAGTGPVPGHAGLTVGAPARPSVFRLDTVPQSGPPGSDVDMMREQLLDRYGIRLAIVHPILDTLGFIQHGELGAALAEATNEWMAEDWLSADERIVGAITVPVEDGNLAAREIERVSADRRFVKVLLTALTREPLGHSKYWPIYEAAVAHRLPVAAHVGGFSGVQTASGWGTFFVEQHTNYVMGYVAQLTSLVYSGVFERFPDLQIVLEEAGIAWLPSLMWRLDRTWETMRDRLPQLERPPSEVVREHFWFATQPLDEPEEPRYMLQTLEASGLSDRVVFSSDYPHHDFDDPERVLLASHIGAELREKIMSTNAQVLLGLHDNGGGGA